MASSFPSALWPKRCWSHISVGTMDTTWVIEPVSYETNELGGSTERQE